VVVVKPDQSVSAEEVIAFCQGKLARYKIPQSVAFVDSLPRTAAGKVLKRDLRDLVGANAPGRL
jgi:acyl-CoA synthetase (AMP-forming)/AMP-acid ligase II